MKSWALVGSIALVACSSTQYVSPPIQNVAIPIKDTTPKPKPPEKEQPPEAGPARDVRFPKVAWAELPNGLKVATIENHALPLVQIRVVVLGGTATDGEKTGVADLTGKMLTEGGAAGLGGKELLAKIEGLGASLSIDTTEDATTLSIGVVRSALGDALALLGGVVAQPGFASAEFEKVKKREVDAAADAARTQGRWGAMMVLRKDLFLMPSEQHPYAAYAATSAEIQKLSLGDVRATHKRLFAPKNAMVIVAGDVAQADVKARAEKAFGTWKGGEAPSVSFGEPMPQEGLKITVVDRPKSTQSDVFVATLGPERKDKDWPAIAVANQVLGGGPAARLFLDIREKQSLAYRTGSAIVQLAHGPSMLVASAGTQTAKTGLTAKALLDQLERIGTEAPSDDEVRDARQFLTDTFALRVETVGGVADALVKNRVLGLPDDYDDAFRKELADVTPPFVAKIAGEHYRPGHAALVVAGDAEVIAPMLAHFGQVKVVDPNKGFERERTLPANPSAPLAVEKTDAAK